jgi:hypothetical protein
MSARILTVAALLASVALRPAAAQGKTDFSGSWKINTEKSDPMGGGMGGGGGGGAGGSGMANAVTTITQTATQLTIETKFGDQTRTTNYSLDGKESTNQGRMGETKSKAHWDGSSLVIQSTGSFNGPNGAMAFTSKEVRTLGDDGKTMTVVTTRSTPNGEVTTKRVFDKQ